MTIRPRRTRTTLTAIAAIAALLAGLGVVAEPVRAGPAAGPAPDDVGFPGHAVLSADAAASAALASEHGVTLERVVLEELDTHGATDFWVGFADRADLSRADEIQDWAERGQYVYDRLVETARASQSRLIAGLTAAGVDHEPFWISNTVLVRGGDQTILNGILESPEVTGVRADQEIELPAPIEESGEASVAAVEWGIANIGADQVWSQLGVRGEGIVVGNIDTGVDYTHPALVNQYRGTVGEDAFEHDYNWWDPSQVCPSAEPCDNNNHGTHTMGTMVGDDGEGNQIGVAPRAQWIAAKGCESRTCSQEALLSSGQFMLAPTDLEGANPRPELRPHIVNNSWGDDGEQDWYDDTVAAWTAAGMFPVFSNGNDGPGCGTAGSPADGPDAYAVGAYDSSNSIAGFSSRGPGRSEEIRPNISAPGVDVRSAIPGGYGLSSGTSMAAPHVAGAVALMWSASDLAGDIAATREALDATAVDTEDLSCGGTPENNNVYGQGRLDALEASLWAALDSGVEGKVVDETGTPVAQVRVEVVETGRSVATGPDGGYRMVLAPGSYTLEFSQFGFITHTEPDVIVVEESFTRVDAGLERPPNGSIAGTVTDEVSGHGVPGVTVEVLDVPVDLAATTDADGEYEITGVPAETYHVQATTSRPDLWWPTEPVEVTVTADGTTTIDVNLPRSQGVEPVWVSSDGELANGDVSLNEGSISADGRYVATFGEAANLVDVPVTGRYNVYVRDRHTGVTELVLPESPWRPSISGAGRYVAVPAPAGQTEAVQPPELPPVPRHIDWDRRLYVRDRVTGETELVSVNDRGEALFARDSSHQLTPDGRYVGFTTRTDHVSEQDLPACTTWFELAVWLCHQVAVHDRVSGDTEVVSVNGDGQVANSDASLLKITPDGRYAFFSSAATNLVEEETSPGWDLFVHDRETGQTEWVPLEPPSGSLNGIGGISDNGRFVTYTYCPAECAFGGFGKRSVIYDRVTGELENLSAPIGEDDPLPSFWGSDAPHISGNGRFATFNQIALNESASGLLSEATGLFILDRQTGQVERLVDRYAGAPPCEGSIFGCRDASVQSVTADGRFVTFSSESDQIVPGDTNGARDLFVVDRGFDPEQPRAMFAVWDLSVSRSTPEPGEPVQVKARVKNVGDAAGDYEAALLVDSLAGGSAAETVTLAPAEVTEVSLTVAREAGGSYHVRIGQASGEFRVQSGTLTGRVSDINDGGAVAGATVTATNGDTTLVATTRAGGAYRLNELQLGTWTVTVEADNFVVETLDVVVAEDGQQLSRDVALRTGVATPDRERIEATVMAGATDTVELTVANSGTADLDWNAFGWDTTAEEDPSILTYSSLAANLGEKTHIDLALQRLELDYTGFREEQPCSTLVEPHPGEGMERFGDALVDGDWDLVIVDHICSIVGMPPSTAEALRAHVADGGGLILYSWQIRQQRSADLPLWETLGVDFTSDFPQSHDPYSVYWWDTDHPLFAGPLAVPEFIVEGRQLLDPLDGFDAPAGYTLTARPEHSALVLGNDGRTLYRGFFDWEGGNNADLDDNGVPDAVQLWTNSIAQVGGLTVNEPWLTANESGTLAPDDSAAVTVSIDATHLKPGSHTGMVELVTDAGREPRVSVPVELTVVGCDRTVNGRHLGPLTVSEGVTCLAEDARVIGPVQVRPGAGLVATGAVVTGPVSATGATVVELRESLVIGPVTVEQATGRVAVVDNRTFGPVRLEDNTTGQTPIVVSGNRIVGPLACTDNQPPPIERGVPNQVRGPKTGQCADL